MTMPLWQGIATVAAVVLGTLVTRFLPFLLFPAGKLAQLIVRTAGKPNHIKQFFSPSAVLRL